VQLTMVRLFDKKNTHDHGDDFVCSHRNRKLHSQLHSNYSNFQPTLPTSLTLAKPVWSVLVHSTAVGSAVVHKSEEKPIGNGTSRNRAMFGKTYWKICGTTTYSAVLSFIGHLIGTSVSFCMPAQS
jgi:hypothetical protein